jgi:hypothetical protein
MRDRGRALDLPHARLVATTVHPSSILRAGAGREAAYQAFVADLRFVGRWLERPQTASA